MAKPPFPPAVKKAAAKKPMTPAQDDAMDRKRGIKENSPADKALDKANGIPPGFKNGGKVGKRKGR